MYTNPLDRLPQIRVDYANHIFYGGIIGLAALAALRVGHAADACALATAAVFAVAAAKKLVDFIKEGESAAECIAKTFVTAAWPASIWIMGAA